MYLFLFFLFRISVIQKDNDRLEKELNELQKKRKEREELEREVTEPPKRELKKDSRMIPGEKIKSGNVAMNLSLKSLNIEVSGLFCH